jgi:enamine deaminase RidA (YjgF/YER057c/UK114 family)
MTIQRTETSRRMSPAVRAGSTIYITGQLAYENQFTDARTQTKEILDRIDRLLAVHGATRKDLVSATVWLSDICYFGEINDLWDDWVAESHAPGRACIEAKIAFDGYKIETQAMA